MDNEFRQGMALLSSRAVLKRFQGIRILENCMKMGCWFSRLALEYCLEHDPNSAVKNRISLVFKRLSMHPDPEKCWERNFAF